MNSNAAVRLRPQEEPQLDLEGTWEIRPRTGEHVLSPLSRQLLGIGDDEPISIQRLLAALHPGDRERWKDAVAEVLDPEGSGECSIEFRTADPVPRWLAASARAFFEGMRAVRVAGTLQDVTGEKRLEEERAFRFRELADDLRTPLAAICRQAIDKALLTHPGHPIEFECWDEAPGEWDRDRLLQVLRHLLSNAIEHGAAGQRVTVSLIDCNQDVLLAVASIGGQPISDPWSSDHLGLSIVSGIVREHGGHFEVISDESATQFHVWLPKKGGLR